MSKQSLDTASGRIRLGTAPASWGIFYATDPNQMPWRRFLDEVAEVGYEWIELGPFGYLPTDLTVLEPELERRRLEISGSFVMQHLEDPSLWPQIEQQTTKVARQLAALGSKFLILLDETYIDPFTGIQTRPRRLDPEAWKHFIEATHKVGALAKHQFGLQVVYHAHADTHIEYEDQLEAFIEVTDPALICLCLDTGHHAYRGGDPVNFMRRHHDHIAYVHLKTVDEEKQKRVEREELTYMKAVQLGTFCEPDQGVVDFRAFANVMRAVDYRGFAMVEQDMYLAPFDKPLPIARRTLEFFREIELA
jgi:inosose dehydratase